MTQPKIKIHDGQIDAKSLIDTLTWVYHNQPGADAEKTLYTLIMDTFISAFDIDFTALVIGGRGKQKLFLAMCAIELQEKALDIIRGRCSDEGWKALVEQNCVEIILVVLKDRCEVSMFTFEGR